MTVGNNPGYLLPGIFNVFVLSGYFKPFILCGMVFYASMIVVQSYYLLKKPDMSFLLKYSPVYCITCYGLATNVTHLVAMNLFLEKIKSSVFSITIETASRRTKKSIHDAVQRIKIVLCLMILTALTLMLTNMYYFNQDADEYIMVSLVLHRYTSRDSVASLLFQWMFNLSFFLLLVPTVTVPIYFIYVIFYIKVQVFMLTDFIYTLRSKLRTSKKRGIKNGVENTRHKYIVKSLKIIARRHFDIIRFNRSMESNELIHMVYLIDGMVIGLGAVFCSFLPTFKLIQSISFLVAFFVFAYCICESGQDFADASLGLAEALYDLDWYNWNLECQKTFLIIFVNSTKGMKVPIFSVLVVDNELIKKISRSLYAVANFLYSTRK